KSTEMKIAIMKRWLDRELIRKDTPATQDAHDRIQATLDEAAELEGELPALSAMISSATGDCEDVARAKFKQELDQIAAAYWKYYRSLDPGEKAAIDHSLKINASAEPEVGQGYVISSGGKQVLPSNVCVKLDLMDERRLADGMVYPRGIELALVAL